MTPVHVVAGVLRVPIVSSVIDPRRLLPREFPDRVERVATMQQAIHDAGHQQQRRPVVRIIDQQVTEQGGCLGELLLFEMLQG